MTGQNRSLEEIKRECEEAASALANQVDDSRDLDSPIREKKLESMERFEHERRVNRAKAIENLECLARLLDRLPAHDFYGYKMTGYDNYLSYTINAALEVLKKNN